MSKGNVHPRTHTIQVRQLAAFVAVADSGSMRLAAQQLGLTQPALTKSLKELEVMTGVVLLERTARGSVPTKAGTVFLSRARSIVEEVRRAHEEMRYLAGVQEGSVTVGLSAGAALLAGEAIDHFIRSQPHLRVRVVAGLFDQLVTGVRQGRLDFAVGGFMAGDNDNRLKFDKLFDYRIVPAVRHQHPLANAKALRDLVDCEWALTTDDPAYIASFTKHFIRLGLKTPRVRLHSESLLAIIETVSCSNLVVAVPETFLLHPIPATYLTPVAVGDPCPKAQFALVRKREVQLTDHANKLARLIAKSATSRRNDVRSASHGRRNG
jgi:LysR family transcriptional regulator of abg operon